MEEVYGYVNATYDHRCEVSEKWYLVTELPSVQPLLVFKMIVECA